MQLAEGKTMTPKQMREAQALLVKRAVARRLIADLGTASVYALELRVPARDGRIFVFSNDQPGAQRELPGALSSTIVEATVTGLAAEVTDIEATLTEMGVADFDQEEEEETA
jgi:hypothetical protein